MDSSTILTQTYPQYIEEIRTIQDFASHFLWHEMSLATLDLLSKQQVQDCFLTFHNECLMFARTYLNPIYYARIVLLIALKIPTQERILFLTEAANATMETEAKLSLECEVACASLLSGSKESKSKYVLNEIHTLLDQKQQHEIHPLLHMQYYRLMYVSAGLEGDHDVHYSSVFKYLAYCDANTTVAARDVKDLTLQLTASALTSKTIHHFGEFITNTTITSHLCGEYAGLLEILQAYNNGDCSVFKEKENLLYEYFPSMRSLAKELEEKMQIMSMLHLTFYLPTSERVISFKKITQRCCMPLEDVEYMLLRALSLNLIQGELDGIAQNIAVTSVAPRVLQQAEILTFKQNLHAWSKRVSDTEARVNTQVEQLTKMFVA